MQRPWAGLRGRRFVDSESCRFRSETNSSQKDCEKLGEAKCTETFYIKIQYSADWLGSGMPVWKVDRQYKPTILSDTTMLPSEVEDLARREVFANALDMMQWFIEKNGYLDGLRIFQVI